MPRDIFLDWEFVFDCSRRRCRSEHSDVVASTGYYLSDEELRSGELLPYGQEYEFYNMNFVCPVPDNSQVDDDLFVCRACGARCTVSGVYIDSVQLAPKFWAIEYDGPMRPMGVMTKVYDVFHGQPGVPRVLVPFNNLHVDAPHRKSAPLEELVSESDADSLEVEVGDEDEFDTYQHPVFDAVFVRRVRQRTKGPSRCQ